MPLPVDQTRSAVKKLGLTLRTGAVTAAFLKKNHKRIVGLVLAPLPKKVALPKLIQSPSPNFSLRGKAITLIVLHDTEGTYSAAVNWLRNPAAQASAHVVLREDGKEATQLVPWSKKAWSCVAFNAQSLNLEMAGKASVGYGAAELDAAASIVAYWCKLYKIPIRDAIGGSQSGITFHQDLGAEGGGHHDPGFNAQQKKAFIAAVRAKSGKGFLPARWGKA